MVVCYLGLGSNLGNKAKNIRLAVKKVSELKDTEVIRFSKVFETSPVGGPLGQPKYLNAALKIRTKLSPQILLKKVKCIEIEIGRRKSVRWGPRAIDLDILFYGEKVINRKGLLIPHPLVFERKFVLKPLSEVI
ncbi:MAG: 2-amino-4-hydroxy-6-hydroxymethyldihydropteridine diphosphokinase [Candidatus Omnitrophica bacterium]|nr:2-amino-4-hydroxy-6-hydroxymethyldihydropteridine diphosphokinase [Candidatus Omnitrophota bacterium]